MADITIRERLMDEFECAINAVMGDYADKPMDSIISDVYKYQFQIIEKELKALEIIKEKDVNINELNYIKTYEECVKIYYNPSIWISYSLFTREEFDLLKEVLEDE